MPKILGNRFKFPSPVPPPWQKNGEYSQAGRFSIEIDEIAYLLNTLVGISGENG